MLSVLRPFFIVSPIPIRTHLGYYLFLSLFRWTYICLVGSCVSVQIADAEEVSLSVHICLLTLVHPVSNAPAPLDTGNDIAGSRRSLLSRRLNGWDGGNSKFR